MQLQPGIDASALAASCRGFTPGDVDLAAQRAAAEAFARARTSGQDAMVTNDDLVMSVQRTRASITPEMLEAFNAEVERFERV
jgi:SpoVK/Ycf46/Vps4 family AAA+-type ATPase